RRQDFDALREVARSLLLERQRLRSLPYSQRVWFVSPAAVPLEPNTLPLPLVLVAGALVGFGFALVLGMVTGRVGEAVRRHRELGV
ncbi:MAG: hypothetical protein AAFT19_07290, partial [Pseudomonadota bacterium]